MTVACVGTLYLQIVRNGSAPPVQDGRWVAGVAAERRRPAPAHRREVGAPSAGVTVQELSTALAAVELRDPAVDVNALRGLKFSSALPTELARHTLASRIGDREAALAVLRENRSIGRSGVD